METKTDERLETIRDRVHRLAEKIKEIGESPDKKYSRQLANEAADLEMQDDIDAFDNKLVELTLAKRLKWQKFYSPYQNEILHTARISKTLMIRLHTIEGRADIINDEGSDATIGGENTCVIIRHVERSLRKISRVLLALESLDLVDMLNETYPPENPTIENEEERITQEIISIADGVEFKAIPESLSDKAYWQVKSTCLDVRLRHIGIGDTKLEALKDLLDNLQKRQEETPPESSNEETTKDGEVN